MRKWGRIGSPHSRKRKCFLRKIARKRGRMRSWRSRGYKNKRSYLNDRARRAKYRPSKKYRKGRGNRGDWARRRYKRRR